MSTSPRLATLNLENLDDKLGEQPARDLAALMTLLQGTPCSNHQVAQTTIAGGEAYDERNLVILSRFLLTAQRQIKHEQAPKLQYRRATANPPDQQAVDITWERPVLSATADVGGNSPSAQCTPQVQDPHQPSGATDYVIHIKDHLGLGRGLFYLSDEACWQALETRVVIDQIFAPPREGTVVLEVTDTRR